MPTSTATAWQKHVSRLTARTLLLALALLSASANGGEWGGDAGIEYRHFLHDPLDAAQHGPNLSVYLQPEYYHDWDDGRQRFVVTPFARLDEGDAERSHIDFRELYWRRSLPNAELYVGLRRVFWGVTEAAHLVDIINQTDQVENIDTEDKLGQPMVALSLLRDWGTVDIYLMPWFRERTFAGRDGRLRPTLVIDESATFYESAAGEKHLDVALRWSHYFGDWDIGVAHFSGTSREPQFALRRSSDGRPVLAPNYAQIEQTSVDVQATKGSWLWKLEAFHRTGMGEGFEALAAGLEYTVIGAGGTSADIGFIAEYLYDNRRSGLAAFDDDLAVGFRLALNDVQSTELLAFTGLDLETSERFTSIEGGRRLGQAWRLNLESRFFSNSPVTSPLSAVRQDDYLELSLVRHF